MDYYALKICSASPNIKLDFTVQRQERVCGREVGDVITRRRGAVWNVLGVQLRGSMDTLWDLPPFPRALVQAVPCAGEEVAENGPWGPCPLLPSGLFRGRREPFILLSHQGCCIVKPSLMTEHNHSVYFFKMAGKDGLIGPL